MNMTTSSNGVQFTAAWEQFSATAYRATKLEEVKGIWTIGFGHTVTGRKPADTTRPVALNVLSDDMQNAAASVARWAHPTINQAQFDALTDLVFNAGDKYIRADDIDGDFDDAVRNGDWPAVRAGLAKFIYQGGQVVKGLQRRTAGRIALFDGKTWQEAERIGRNA